MSEAEKAAVLIRMVAELKAIRRDLSAFHGRSREIADGLQAISTQLRSYLPDADVITQHASALVSADELTNLAREIREAFDRKSFLEGELKAADIQVPE